MVFKIKSLAVAISEAVTQGGSLNTHVYSYLKAFIIFALIRWMWAYC